MSRVTEVMVEALQAAHNLIANTAFDAGESHDWAEFFDGRFESLPAAPEDTHHGR